MMHNTCGWSLCAVWWTETQAHGGSCITLVGGLCAQFGGLKCRHIVDHA